MRNKEKELFTNNKIPIKYDNEGNKIIQCDYCGSILKCLGTTDNFYSSHDLYICTKCNKGYKAEIFTSLTTEQYISIEPTLISDINIIINAKNTMAKYREKTREEIARNTVKQGRPSKKA